MNLLAASKPLVDWTSLGKVLALSVVFGVGIVLVMSISIRLLADADGRSGARRTASTVGAAIGIIIVLGAVGFGIFTMMQK
jgi:hypothetical protein